jgi:hypothetical protein
MFRGKNNKKGIAFKGFHFLSINKNYKKKRSERLIFLLNY